ncbi:MAG: F0F1 ATP synthase subunit epsilon [Ruminococcaceae bacterium]|nr:F0F1 ATP synthase subunit epsilon [Oscillospiraceae bacterium]
MRSFTLSILAVDCPLYVGESTYVNVPMAEGSYGILAHHCNTIAALVPGMVEFTDSEGNRRKAKISDGMIKIENNDVLLLAASAEYIE